MGKKYFAYQIEDGGCGLVTANNATEAEQKVREAYKVHSYLSDTTDVWIDEPSWFEDFPDVIEVGE